MLSSGNVRCKLADHRKGKGCPTMALIGSIGGRVAAGALFILRGRSGGVVPRGRRAYSSKQGVTRVRRLDDSTAGC